VGNEPFDAVGTTKGMIDLFTEVFDKVVLAVKGDSRFRVTVPFSAKIFVKYSTWPPLKAEIKKTAKDFVKHVTETALAHEYPFTMNIYPFFNFFESAKERKKPCQYREEEKIPSSSGEEKTGPKLLPNKKYRSKEYYSQFHLQVASIRYALKRLYCEYWSADYEDSSGKDVCAPGGETLHNKIWGDRTQTNQQELKLIIGETGWPWDKDKSLDTAGLHSEFRKAIDKTMVEGFYKTVIKQTSNPPGAEGHRDFDLEGVYLFEAFDESEKWGEPFEKHFGLMDKDGLFKFGNDLHTAITDATGKTP